MSVFEVKTDARTWLRNRRKDDLIYIILANLDRINLFADASDAGKDGMPPKAEVKANHLCLGIGISTLAWAFEHGENNNPYNESTHDFKQRYRISDLLQFANDVCHEMNDEGEDGSTPLTRFLDSMMDRAVEQGSLGIHDPDDTADSKEERAAIARKAGIASGAARARKAKAK